MELTLEQALKAALQKIGMMAIEGDLLREENARLHEQIAQMASKGEPVVGTLTAAPNEEPDYQRATEADAA